jgi:hypothetical protein
LSSAAISAGSMFNRRLSDRSLSILIGYTTHPDSVAYADDPDDLHIENLYSFSSLGGLKQR